MTRASSAGLDRFEGVSTSPILDIPGRSQVPNGILPLNPEGRLAGPAVTERAWPRDNLTCHAACSLPLPATCSWWTAVAGHIALGGDCCGHGAGP